MKSHLGIFSLVIHDRRRESLLTCLLSGTFAHLSPLGQFSLYVQNLQPYCIRTYGTGSVLAEGKSRHRVLDKWQSTQPPQLRFPSRPESVGFAPTTG